MHQHIQEVAQYFFIAKSDGRVLELYALYVQLEQKF